MAKDKRAHVLEFLAAIHQADRPDFNKLAAFFTETGTYQVLVPTTKPVKGRAGIAAELEKQFKTYHDCECEVHAVAADGLFVFTERTDHVTLYHDERKIDTRVCAVFEFDENGLIQSWREYWDSGYIFPQLGITEAEFRASIN